MIKKKGTVSIDDFKVPKGKEREFCDHIAFSAWESENRGYNWLWLDNYILKYIKQLQND